MDQFKGRGHHDLRAGLFAALLRQLDPEGVEPGRVGHGGNRADAVIACRTCGFRNTLEGPGSISALK